MRKLVRALALVIGLYACKDNMLGGNVQPVPPVHRVPADVEGLVVLVAEDAAIESRDPAHIERAKEMRLPQDFRASMVRAFELAGFKVASAKDQPHDLVARLALAVSEADGKVRQVYRCGLRTPEGREVQQIDWAWPQGTYVDVYEVLDFATHHVATEVATSQTVVGHLRAARGAARSQKNVEAGAIAP